MTFQSCGSSSKLVRRRNFSIRVNLLSSRAVRQSHSGSRTRNQKDEAQAFEQRTERDKDRGGDALAAGKGGKIAQQKPQIRCETPVDLLIGSRNRHDRSSLAIEGSTATLSDVEKTMPAFIQRHTRQLPGGKGAGVDIDPVR